MRYSDLHPVIRATIEGRLAEPYRGGTVTAPVLCYVIQAGDDGPVKVGHACNVAARLASLRVANPAPLHVRYTFTDGIRVEAVLHDLLSAYALTGEWFTVAALPAISGWAKQHAPHCRVS